MAVVFRLELLALLMRLTEANLEVKSEHKRNSPLISSDLGIKA